MKPRRGMALAVILMATALLFVVAVAAVTEATTDLNLVTSRIHAERAFYAAEGGLQLALVEIDMNGVLPPDFHQFQALSQGSPDSYQVEHYLHGGHPPDGTDIPPNTHYLIATGRTDRGTTCTVACLCTRNAVLYNQGILADTLQASDGGVDIDAWNSDVDADYAPENRIYGLDLVSTNNVAPGIINFNDQSYIHGKVNSGPGSDPNQVITGGHIDDKEPLPEKILIDDPGTPHPKGPYHSGTKTFDSGPDSLKPGAYEHVQIKDGAVVTFHPGTYVVDSLEVTNGGKLKVDLEDASAKHPVEIFVNGHMDIRGDDSIVNQMKKASFLRLVYRGVGDTLNMSGGSQAFFTLRAPDSDIHFEPTNAAVTQAYGAMQARNVTMKHARFHYDVGLRQDGFSLGHLLVLSHRRL